MAFDGDNPCGKAELAFAFWTVVLAVSLDDLRASLGSGQASTVKLFKADLHLGGKLKALDRADPTSS